MHSDYLAAIVLLIIIIIIYALTNFPRLKQNWETLKSTRKIIDDIASGNHTAEMESEELTTLILTKEITDTFAPDFSKLSSLKGNTINEYYVVKEGYQLNKNEFLLLADILTFELVPGKPTFKKGFNSYVDRDLLYPSHILVCVEIMKGRIEFYSSIPQNDEHLAHLMELCNYLCSLLVGEEYKFTIPERPRSSGIYRT